MKKHTSLKSKFNSAFSLVELLVVIAVIAVIAAIAIPNIAGITGAAGIAKHQRNAQSIAAMYNNAVAAGLDTTAINNREDAVDLITDPAGVVVSGVSFRVDGISAEDITTATTYTDLIAPSKTLKNLTAPSPAL
jgi:prepilin-type N-terminal cleavage/methylation domain-containing protein